MSPIGAKNLSEFLIRTKKGRILVVAALLGGSLILVLASAGRRRSEASARSPSPSAASAPGGGDLPPSPTGFGETLTLGQKYDALISRFGGDLATTKSELDATRKELEGLRAALQGEKSSQEKERKDLGDTLQKLRDGVARELGAGRVPTPATAAGPERPPLQAKAGSLRTLELGASPPIERREKRSVRIPTASGGEATLLNGVFAPVSGEPSPVRLRLDAAILGPNRARVGLRNSYLIGKASGDPNGCRVSIQIDKFSTVKDGGEALESKALGYVVGEDGLEGVPGSYEWRATQYLPLALGAGGLQGLSGAFAQTQTTSTLSPLGGSSTVLTGDSMKFAGAQSLGGASSKLAEIVAERMKEIRPAVSTPAHRAVTVVFLEGLTLEGLDPKELGDAKETDPFHGLDAPR